MKIATALVFAALVCAAQAQIFPSIASGIAQSAKDRIEEMRKTIDEQLQQAEERLQTAYKQARDRVQGAYKRLEDAADNVRQRVKETVGNFQESIQSQINKLTESAKAQGADLSKCMTLVQPFRNAGDAVVSDSSSCVTDKVKKGNEIATNVLKTGQDSLDVIAGIRSQSDQCVENVQDISEQISAASCLISVGAKASWALTTKVPAVARDFAKATVLITTLPPSLTYCMSKNSILAFSEQGSTVLADVRKCVANIISSPPGIDKNEIPVVPEVPEVAEVQEAQKVQEVPKPTPSLVLPGFEEVPLNQA